MYVEWWKRENLTLMQLLVSNALKLLFHHGTEKIMSRSLQIAHFKTFFLYLVKIVVLFLRVLKSYRVANMYEHYTLFLNAHILQF